MLRTALAAILLLTGSSAFAAERAHGVEQQCPDKLADLKKVAPKEIKITTLTPGQVHVAQGLFLNADPPSGSMPPVDGAILLTQHGKKIGKILWLKADRVCGGFDIPMPQVTFVLSINTAPGEKADTDDPKDEQSL